LGESCTVGVAPSVIYNRRKHSKENMILGVYWYFDFPKSLYDYKFFMFHKGSGGHGNSPAELIANVTLENVEGLLEELRILVEIHSGSSLYIHKTNKHLKLGIPEYQFFDFEFEFAQKIEELFIKYNVKSDDYLHSTEKEVIRLFNRPLNIDESTRKNLLQIVGSPLKYEGAETTSVRLDCNIQIEKKDNFLNSLIVICNEHELSVLHFLEKTVDDRINLMIFFSNGRQGINFSPKQNVDIGALENRIEKAISNYGVQLGHIEGFENYPSGNSYTIMIKDQEYIMGDVDNTRYIPVQV
jgi:hypothetical protein